MEQADAGDARTHPANHWQEERGDDAQAVVTCAWQYPYNTDAAKSQIVSYSATRVRELMCLNPSNLEYTAAWYALAPSAPPASWNASLAASACGVTSSDAALRPTSALTTPRIFMRSFLAAPLALLSRLSLMLASWLSAGPPMLKPTCAERSVFSGSPHCLASFSRNAVRPCQRRPASTRPLKLAPVCVQIALAGLGSDSPSRLTKHQLQPVQQTFECPVCNTQPIST